MNDILIHINTIECELNIMLSRIEKLKRYILDGYNEGRGGDESEEVSDTQPGN